MMRTIWVAIRGINYTDRATREVGKNVDELIKAQQRLRQQSIAMLAAGVMFTTMAALMVVALKQVVVATGEGQRMMHQFDKATNQLMKGLSSAFVDILGPSIKTLSALITILAQNPVVMKFAAALMTLGIALIMVKGVSMLAGGSFNLIMQQMTTMGVVSVGTAGTMTMAFLRLQAAMGPVIMGFTLGSMMASMMGKNAWILIPIIGALTVIFTMLAATMWNAAGALAVLTFGAAAVAGAVAIAYAASQTPHYQLGTRYARQTQMALVHEGEMLTPMREQMQGSRGSPIRSPVGSTAPFTKEKTEVHFHIGTLQTKADREQLAPMILKILKDHTDNKV